MFLFNYKIYQFFSFLKFGIHQFFVTPNSTHVDPLALILSNNFFFFLFHLYYRPHIFFKVRNFCFCSTIKFINFVFANLNLSVSCFFFCQLISFLLHPNSTHFDPLALILSNKFFFFFSISSFYYRPHILLINH